MNDNELIWKIESTEKLLHTPVFDVLQQRETAANGMAGDYIAMEAPDWVMVIGEYRGCFVTVRQWRHASQELTTEFPGGCADAGEDPAVTAERELFEETGFKVGRLTKLGDCSPNPALMKNRFHVFLAQELIPTGEQALDDDELLTYRLTPIDEMITSFGKGEFSHALTGTALAYYMQYHYLKNKEFRP